MKKLKFLGAFNSPFQRPIDYYTKILKPKYLKNED